MRLVGREKLDQFCTEHADCRNWIAAWIADVGAARWRTPQNGKSDRYLVLTVSDASGQYSASCFDEATQALCDAALKSAEPVQFQGEAQWRPGDEAPRLSINGLVPLAWAVK